METNQQRRLAAAFAAVGAGATPLGRALCSALGAAQPVMELFAQFYRTISTEAPDARLFLSALHHLALTGGAPTLAAAFPSCGGDAADFDAAAAIAAVADHREDLFDYMLSHTVRPQLVEWAAPLREGLQAVAARFGGGVALVEFGCRGGLLLLLDQYGEPAPLVVGRFGLDPAPCNPADEADRLLLESFLWPDETERLQDLRRAAVVLGAHGPLPLRQGEADTDLLPLLAEAYAAMPAGNTLVVMNAFVWPELGEPERRQVAWAIQHRAAHLEPGKPLAWLQLEPNAAGRVELRLQTFGDTDPEDRDVRVLASYPPA